ncbi:MAG: type IX secretion system membrane protein PorP/SprF [Saprospiraceae bacterium]|nr:type IX secretion system membrane protein PorP/SprF [Saprospiraceae bacterium]
MDSKQHIDQIIRDKATSQNYDFKPEYWDEMESVLNKNKKIIKSPFLKASFVKYISLNILFLVTTVIVALVLSNKNDLNSDNLAQNNSVQNESFVQAEVVKNAIAKGNLLNSESTNEEIEIHDKETSKPEIKNTKIAKPNSNKPTADSKKPTTNSKKPTAESKKITGKIAFFPPKPVMNDSITNESVTENKDENENNSELSLSVDSSKTTKTQKPDNKIIPEIESNNPEEEPPIRREFDFNEFVLRTANKFWENPAVTGVVNQKVFSLNYENLNPKFNNDPNQFLLAFDTKISNKLGIGTYLSYFNQDKNYTLATANISLSYCLRMDEYQKLIIGSGFNYVSNSFYGSSKSSFYNELWGDLKENADEKYFDLNTGLMYMYKNHYLISGISHAVNTANSGLAYNIATGTSFELNRNLKLHPSIKFENDAQRQIKNRLFLVNYLAIKEKYIAGIEFNFNDVNLNPHFGMKLSKCLSFNIEPGISLKNNVELNYFMARLSFHLIPYKEKRIREIITPIF